MIWFETGTVLPGMVILLQQVNFVCSSAIWFGLAMFSAEWQALIQNQLEESPISMSKIMKKLCLL